MRAYKNDAVTGELYKSDVDPSGEGMFFKCFLLEALLYLPVNIFICILLSVDVCEMGQTGDEISAALFKRARSHIYPVLTRHSVH